MLIMVRRRPWLLVAFLLVALAASYLYVLPSFAQEALPEECPGLSTKECNNLKSEYEKLQEEIGQWQQVLDATRAKKNTLSGDVSALNAQISQAEAQIKQKNVAISRIGGDIRSKTARINELSGRIENGHDSLASFLREQNQIDDLSLVEIALAADNAFALFEDVDNIVTVQAGLHDEFAQIREAREETEDERAALAKQEAAEQDAKYVVETKKQEIDKNKAAKNELLAIATNEEQQYSQVLAERQAQAAAIRARLFPLRDTENIDFQSALRYAQAASAKTGVRAAVILAVLSQESDLGKNIGNCYVTNSPNQGDGVGKNTGTAISGVMHPTRDVPVFLRITEALGKDWKTTPVSCPQAAGYGGAMGPTQFIPSTWALFEPRIKAALGVAATNPWNAEHAMMATGLYLGDWNAASGGYTAERNAACAYFSGKACPATGWVTSYGDQVMAKAAKFQQDIDFLKDN